MLALLLGAWVKCLSVPVSLSRIYMYIRIHDHNIVGGSVVRTFFLPLSL